MRLLSDWGFLLGLPAAWIVLFGLYRLRVQRRGRYRVASVERQSHHLWLPRTLIEFAYWLYQVPVRALVRVGISADTLTAASVLLSLVAAVLIARGHFGSGGWVLLLAFTCDVWDGMVARLGNTSSRAGEFLDATFDRYSDLIAFGGFLFYYREQPLPFLLILSALIGSTLVSYARARGECLGVIAEVGYMRRYERAVWLGGGTVLAPLLARLLEPGVTRPQYHLTLVVMVLLAVLTHVTAVWRILYVLRVLRAVPAKAKVDHAG